MENLLNEIIKVVSKLDNFDEWFEVSDLENLLIKHKVNYKSAGYSRLVDFLMENSDNFKVKIDLDSKNQKFLSTFIGKPYIDSNEYAEELTNNIIDNKNSIDVLTLIAENWKLDARLESKHNYYYHLNETKSILNGTKYYIIGRKGSGKSSISEYLLSMNNESSFTEKLSFKNFPFNDLYSLNNPSYTQPNQYITLWKYLIYSTVVKLMIKSSKVDSDIRSQLSSIYNPSPIISLPRTINEWTSPEFGTSILGSKGSIKLDNNYNQQNVSWIDRVNILEDIIIKYCDDSKYFIIFDELDEDYRKIAPNYIEQYNFLLTSLFKAVQDIKYTLSATNLNILPVVFLRDDIYSLIKDADKNKWRDFKIEIEWNSEKIKQLLAYRISKDIGEVKILDFKTAWDFIFYPSKVKIGSGKNYVDSFDYITRSTHLRPRDYIRFIQVCAEETINYGRNKIPRETIKFVDRAFSNYLKDEIIDEIYPVLPDIEEIFQIISNLRKWVFGVDEFKREYLKYLRAKTVKEENIDYVLDTLYKFSVIGNQNRYKMETIYFKYLHTNMNLNRNEKLVVHRGLFKALQII